MGQPDAPVNDERGPGDVLGGVGKQVSHGVGDLLGPTEAAQGDHGLHRLAAGRDIPEDLGRHAGVHDPWRHHVHANPVRGELKGKALGEHVEAGLRHAVRQQAPGGGGADPRADEHDRAAPFGADQFPADRLGGEERALEVDVEHVPPLLVGLLQRHRPVGDPGGRHKTVDVAVPLDRGSQQPLYVLWSAYVGLEVADPGGLRGFGGVGGCAEEHLALGLTEHVARRDASAPGAQPGHQRTADVTGRPSDEEYPLLQLTLHGEVPLPPGRRTRRRWPRRPGRRAAGRPR